MAISLLAYANSGCELLLRPRAELVDGGASMLDAAGADGSTACGKDLDSDPDNCGACGHWCCEGACEKGTCTTVELGSGGEPKHLALDDDRVYWHDRSDGTIRTRPKSQVGAELVIANAPAGAEVALGVGADDVFVAGGGALFRAPKLGGAKVNLATVDAPGAVAVVGATIYFSDGNEIRRVERDGSGAAVVATADLPPLTFMARSPFMYLTGKLVRMPLPGGALAGPRVDTTWLALDTDQAYAVEFRGGQSVVIRVSLGAFSTATDVLTLSRIEGIAVDETALYLADYDARAIVRYSKAGSERTVLADGQASPTALVADARCLYWSNPYGDGRVLKRAK